MIYDCFPFLNELELLDIRLHELDKYVDRFVIEEAIETHQGQPKHLYYEENKDKFADFHDKIIHIKLEKFTGILANPEDVEDIPTVYNLARGTWQTNQLMQGLTECQPNDIIMCSDADEIASPHAIKQLAGITEMKSLLQKEYYCWLNCFTGLSYITTGVAPFHLINKGMLDLRSHAGPEITNGGWNFTYLGGGARIKQKLKSFQHGDYIPDIIAEQLDELIRQDPPYDIGKGGYGRKMQIVPIDNSYPKYIHDNLDKFKDLIWPGV